MTELQFQVIGREGMEWTDSPRALTAEETQLVAGALSNHGKLEAIKTYRAMTNATLKAAVQFIGNIARRAREES